ncbi:MAG: exodeoxyribonuclease VII large subunit [Acidimicrobiales bacterium]|nr:exodeoxyribonuclease VII large subunit [Acidimicrobiales bacterium]
MREATFSVAELAMELRQQLGQAFPDDVWVTGEVSDFRGRSRGGQVYFDIVEPAERSGPPPARLNVVLWRDNRDIVNKLLKRAGITRIEDGMKVRIRCVVDFYPPQGRLQLRMTSIDPTYTVGQQELERQQLLAKLAAEGVFELQKGLSIAAAPRHIGLVTSEGSAAYHDFMNELAASGYGWSVTLIDTAVQGPHAPAGIAGALLTLERHHVDVIALVRGGGSRGDLGAFDTEVVARAIAQLRTPVVTGIGHEIDRSIADEAAHTARKTPTACAADLIERAGSYHQQIETHWVAILDHADAALTAAHTGQAQRAERANRGVRATLAMHEASIATAASRAGRAALMVTDHAADRLDRDADFVGTRAERLLYQADQLLETAAIRHRALDPARTLARGWSITTTADGEIVRSTQQVQTGQEVITQVADGRLTTRIESVRSSTDGGTNG